MLTVNDLIACFNGCFKDEYHVVLVGGALEPLYTPIQYDEAPAKIHFRLDYISSALHEISHWCIAGLERLKLEDYGYWYETDSRTLELQKKFEVVEIKPQAIEMAFHKVLGLPFRVSADNLSLLDYDTSNFERAVNSQFHTYLKVGFPARAQAFCECLLKYQGINRSLYDYLK
ncbi:elongation factor P hydroxylase [Marinomonas sp. 15G1-11]|uniref:Elongation factor P hydroxylase n=1 Tax=Marinomonas phaeophyticola TaxID=3004091 RepID=A0ABT4JVH3_9GAMM|nr:elongation factor P hydroxylase [Marinomonas sp. 15G1-11]MCZ2722251.1 elongation factor P hydroxylase [Marinomonas sp. 15G1-11]